MQTVLIVAHGQPSDPEPAAAELAAFADRVSQHLPERRVTAATLALSGAMEAAVLGAEPGGLVFPLFMAGGWFARTHLPARLRELGAVGWRVLEPLGCDPAVHELAIQVVAEALSDKPETAARELLLAAHGSFKTSVPSDIARHVAARLGAELALSRSEAAFIDQAPRLAEVHGFSHHAVCLPFFAAAGGHVVNDIPAALAEAGFPGRLLPPLGLDPRVPALVAAAIGRAAPVCCAECRFKRPELRV